MSKEQLEERTVDLLQDVEVLDVEGKIIKDADGKVPTIKSLIDRAYRIATDKDMKDGFKEKNARFLILKRIEKVDEISFTKKELDEVCERIGSVFVQAALVGKFAELLHGHS